MLALVKVRAGAQSVLYASELAQLNGNLFRQKKQTEAESPLRECLAIREKLQADASTTFNMKSMLGGVLLSQNKFPDAEIKMGTRTGIENLCSREAPRRAGPVP
ncbi:MAG: hypothetical protein ACJ8FY_28000 [Gemmataceae bacterium]